MDRPRDPLQEELAQLRRELRLLRNEQRRQDERLSKLLDHALVRALRKLIRAAGVVRGWAGQKLLHSPLHPVYLRLGGNAVVDAGYAEWSAWEQAAAAAAAARSKPVRNVKISVLMPVRNPRRPWLEEAVASVAAQSHDHWELCVCDDASGDPWVAEFIGRQGDPRIRYARLDTQTGISAAMNRAAAMASGEYLAFLDHDDTLSPSALALFAAAAADSGAGLLYSDQETTDPGGTPIVPVLKPAWSPTLLTTGMYCGHLLAVSRAAFDLVGGFRSEFDLAQDFDLALRVSELGLPVRHVPYILYRWRAHAGSTASGISAKPGSHEAGRRALEDAVARRQWTASVLDGFAPASYEVRHRPHYPVLASVVICSRNPKLLARCLRGIERRTGYGKREILVIEHRTGASAAFDAVAARYGYRRLVHAAPFDFAGMNNAAAAAAGGEVLLFLNDDVLPLVPEWLELMAGRAMRPEVGVVGALLLYRSGTIQHAGIVAGMVGGMGHPLRGSYASRYWRWTPLARNVAAVTAACMAVRKEVFHQLGGFDAQFPVNYNDVDFCLRALRAGYEVVIEPAARLRHDESRSRVGSTRYTERELIWQRWGEIFVDGDPYWNPHLSLDSETPLLRTRR